MGGVEWVCPVVSLQRQTRVVDVEDNEYGEEEEEEEDEKGDQWECVIEDAPSTLQTWYWEDEDSATVGSALRAGIQCRRWARRRYPAHFK